EVRGRTYGGGVLKLEPSDVQQLVVPSMTKELRVELTRALPLVDWLLRHGKPDDARRLVDDVLIRSGWVTSQEMTAMHSELSRVRAHRKNRGAVHKAMARRANIKPSTSSGS